MAPFDDVDRQDKSDGDRYLSPTTSTGQRQSRAASPWYGHPEERERMGEEPRGRVYLSPRRYAASMPMRQEQYDSADRSASARPHYYDGMTRRSTSSTPSPLRTFTGKRRASGEMAAYFSDELDDSPRQSRSNRNEAESAEKVNYIDRNIDVGGWSHREAGLAYERRSEAAFMDQQQGLDRYYQQYERPSGSRNHISSAADAYRTASTRQRISGLRISPASTMRLHGYGSYAHSAVLDDDRPFRAMGTGWEAMRSSAEAVTGVPAVAIGTSANSPTPSSVSSQAAAPPAAATTIVPVRPITNASRNIKFGMLQPHFERPLQEAALKFGVCTTLLKKICRKNGIANWPYRRICGLRKSIASMEKQVQYFDGDQKKSYADQLKKLQIELEAYKRIGTAPTPEFIDLMEKEDAAAPEEAHGDESTEDNDLGDRGEEGEQQQPRSSGQPVVPMHSSRVGCEVGKANSNSSIQGSDVQEFRHGDVTSAGGSWMQPYSSVPQTDGHRDPRYGHGQLREVTAVGDSDHYSHHYEYDRSHEYDRRHENEYRLGQHPYQQHQHFHQHHHQHRHHHQTHAQQQYQYYQSDHHHRNHRAEPSTLGLSTIGAHQRALPSIGHMLGRQHTRNSPGEREEKARRHLEDHEEQQYQF